MTDLWPTYDLYLSGFHQQLRYDQPKNRFSGFTQAINQHFLETTPLVSTVAAKRKSAVDIIEVYKFYVYENIAFFNSE